MPTEDRSNRTHIARVRQKAALKGLNKVVRALDIDTQLSIKLGGLTHITKTSNGKETDCSCNIPTACDGIGQFQIIGTPFVVDCNGTTCNVLGTEFPVSYTEILAIPGTNFTVGNEITVCMVNCSASNVYWSNDERSVIGDQNILIPPGQAYIYQPPPYTQGFFITYSFYDSP